MIAVSDVRFYSGVSNGNGVLMTRKAREWDDVRALLSKPPTQDWDPRTVVGE
jgi:hypothetical protein